MAVYKKVMLTASDGLTTATFLPQQGGLGVSLTMPSTQGKRELLYFPPDFSLETYQNIVGGWPFLFPICGRVSRQDERNCYLYDGKVYPLNIHGFAYQLPWQIVFQSQERLSLRLRENSQTLRQYPFAFEITLTYEVSPGKLTCYQQYTNRGDQPMPYYAGFHPYFRVEAEKSTVWVDYRPVRRFRYNATLTDVIGEAPLFQTPAPVSLPELNESLVELGEDKTVSLTFPDQSQILMHAEGIEDDKLFPYLQLYHRPEAPFLCIEPWMAFPNALNTVQGVRWLKPGMSDRGLLTLQWIEKSK